jgi:hypothetical protein
MLGHGNPRACDNKGGGGGDVQSALAITAGADDVHCPLGRADGIAFGAHDRGRGGVFIHRFAARAQRHQKPAHLRRCGHAFKQRAKGGLCLGPGQGAYGCDADQGFEDIAHAATRALAASRKFFSK